MNKHFPEENKNVGKNVGKRQFLCTVDGNVCWCSQYGGFSKK